MGYNKYLFSKHYNPEKININYPWTCQFSKIENRGIWGVSKIAQDNEGLFNKLRLKYTSKRHSKLCINNSYYLHMILNNKAIKGGNNILFFLMTFSIIIKDI